MDQPTEQPTNQQTNMSVHWKVTFLKPRKGKKHADKFPAPNWFVGRREERGGGRGR